MVALLFFFVLFCSCCCLFVFAVDATATTANDVYVPMDKMLQVLCMTELTKACQVVYGKRPRPRIEYKVSDVGVGVDEWCTRILNEGVECRMQDVY